MDQAGVNAGEDDARGLENHLRNMILTNQPPSDQPSGLDHSTSVEALQTLQTPKTSKKRPNQAQRRQMAAQFNVPMDTRPPPPPEQTRHHGWNSYGQQQWQSPSNTQHRFRHDGHGRGHDSMSHSNHHQHPQGLWNGANRRPPPGRAGFSSQSHHHYHGANQTPPDGQSSYGWRQGPGPPAHSRPLFTPEQLDMQAAMLDQLSFRVVSGSEIDRVEIMEKENFRIRIEQIIRDTIARHEVELTQRGDFPALSVELKCFGSLSSGFATKASDMDLALLSPLSAVQPEAKGSPIPRLLEKALLDAGIAARLLSKTRVPIIKLCEKPPEILFQRLLNYREKWEKGEFEETHEDQDDEDEHEAHTKDANSPSDEKEQPSNTTQHDEAQASDKVEFEVPSIGSAGTQKFYLKQGPVTSLDGYYGLAKRVLRKIGGRDVRTPTASSLSETEWEILNRLCEAYIQGLTNASLRDRLKRYLSLSFDPIRDVPDRHSLIGVAAQVEGEHIFQIWEKSALRPDEGYLRLKSVENRGLQPEEAYQTWKSLQQRVTYGTDPVSFAKQVQLHLDALRKIPAVQTILLEQGQDETPTQYHQRANKVLYQLRGQYREDNGILEHVFITYYVQGIKPKEVRVLVEEAQVSAGEQLSLGAVARKHKSVQLIREFTRALDKDLVPAEYKANVEQYIRMLQTPLRETPQRHATKGHVKYDFVVPVTSETLIVLNRIRQLPDPNILAPSQQTNKYRDMLEFPKTGAGVQCDINFSAHLALENTLLLRCYSHTDSRVRPMILFIKHWAKTRGINSGYRGTLSSYGYVLMVLHYLINVVQPFVCPNLQQLAPPPPPHLSPAEVESINTFRGYNIQFWRNEEEIKHLASLNQLNHNTESIGHLLRGFFEYYAQSGPLHTIANAKGFDWGREVVSLRTQGGIITKHAKGWTGAKTIYQTTNDNTSSDQTADQSTDLNKSKARPGKGDGIKEVRLRYLFAIEDPFELDHNVARTVTHNGIVSIRDEFRRAWRIIKTAGEGNTDEDLLKDISEQQITVGHDWYSELLTEIHGSLVFS